MDVAVMIIKAMLVQALSKRGREVSVRACATNSGCGNYQK